MASPDAGSQPDQLHTTLHQGSQLQRHSQFREALALIEPQLKVSRAPELLQIAARKPLRDFRRPSLTDFKRHTSELAEQIKTTGRPLVLTVNGKAELVVQDAASYQALLDAVEQAVTIAGIQRGLEQMARGEGRLASEAFAEFRTRHGLDTAVDNESAVP